MNKEDVIRSIDMVIDADPSICEDIMRLVAEKMYAFRENAMKQSNKIAADGINYLSALAFMQETNNNRDIFIEFCLPAVIHEFSHKQRGSNATNKMALEFARVIKSKPDMDAYIQWVEKMYGKIGADTVKWVVSEFDK